MDLPKIDVIIPFYNAAPTLNRAVESVLTQHELATLWLIDDGSTDNSSETARQFSRQFPAQVRYERMPKNCGVAKARNWGALQSAAEFIAFLDADDAYEVGALETAGSVFHFRPQVSVVRLALTPVGLAEHYRQHPDFDYAWQHMRMTCGDNVVFRRSFFLACGGFPQDELFHRHGGEDGALGIATTLTADVATLFHEPGVLHYCRDGMHAERLLDAILFNRMPDDITAEQIAQANAVTENICRRIRQLKAALNTENIGIHPLTIERNQDQT